MRKKYVPPLALAMAVSWLIIASTAAAAESMPGAKGQTRRQTTDKVNQGYVVEQPEHALCKGVFPAEGFFIKDEIYQMKAPYARDQVQVLLSADIERSEVPHKPINRKDRDFPLSWIKPYGKGRVFYSALGHNKAVFSNVQVLQHWLNAMQQQVMSVIQDLKKRWSRRTLALARLSWNRRWPKPGLQIRRK